MLHYTSGAHELLADIPSFYKIAEAQCGFLYKYTQIMYIYTYARICSCLRIQNPLKTQALRNR
jgi:hypothetical protein